MTPLQLGFPGPLRDQLVDAVLSGRKTTTTGLLLDYEHSGEALPQPGQRLALLDSNDQTVAEIETVAVRVCPLSEVDIRHVHDEGEGYTDYASWRATHEKFFHSEEMRAALQRPDFVVTDDTRVVLQRFRVVRLSGDPRALGQ